MSGNVAAGFKPIRHDQLYQEGPHDPYLAKGALPDPAFCGDCGAVYQAGRWCWGVPPEDAKETTCPACARIQDHQPAGFLFLEGGFFTAHKEELMGVLRHQEEKQKDDHPLRRIVAVEENGDQTTVTTTDIHLARDLGTALHDAYQGDLELHYNPNEWLLRVHWQR